VNVRPGEVIEVRSPEPETGTSAEVNTLFEQPSPKPGRLSGFRGAAKGLYGSVDEVDAFIRSERDADAGGTVGKAVAGG